MNTERSEATIIPFPERRDPEENVRRLGELATVTGIFDLKNVKLLEKSMRDHESWREAQDNITARSKRKNFQLIQSEDH